MRQQLLVIGLAAIIVFAFSTTSWSEVIRDIKETDTLITKDGKAVHILGVRTPLYRETMFKDYYGTETFKYIEKMVKNKDVRLEVVKGQLSIEGFFKAYVYLPDGKMLNLELLRKGMGRVREEKFKNKYEKEFLEAQKEAQSKNLGIWSVNRAKWEDDQFVPSDKGSLPEAEKPEREETIHVDY